MIYKLYRKATGEDAGQVLAIISEDESKIIDDFEVYLITNSSPVELKAYKGNDIKVYGEGRPLWSEITWTKNGKWQALDTDIDLSKIVAGMSSPQFAEFLTELTDYFL